MLDAEQLKLELGVRAKNIIANGVGIVQGKGDKVLCPLHSDKNPSMSWFNKGLMWRCHACQGKIDIYDYYQKYERMNFREAVDKVANILGREEVEPIRVVKEEYALPNIKTVELTKPFVDYMGLRQIKKETLDHWKVKQRKWSGNDVYVFPYYNQDNKLEYVSYRGLGKGAIKGGCEPNTKPILWGMNNIDKNKPLVITEGQPDAMVVWQSGYKNVVSVPNGSNNLKWLDTCWEWLKGIKEFIVWADNDRPGLKMADDIKAKLNNVKVIVAKEKDANEVLFHHGPQKVKQYIDEAIKETPEGLLDLSQVEYKSAMAQSDNGIETGFYEYDYHVEDWKPTELTVIFGRNGEGKTTYVSQIIAHCIEKKQNTFLYSGEMSDDKIQDWLYRQMVGNNKDNLRTIVTKYKDKVEPKPDVIKRIKKWHEGKLFIYDRNEREITGNIEKFFDVMEIAAKRYGVRLFVIDNLMAILEENADSLYSDQANFVQRCKNFAITNKVHVVLVAHPNKEKKEIRNGIDGNLDKTDISGSNNIPNKADNIIAVERLWGPDVDCDAIVTSLKDRNTGQRKQMRFFFSSETLRFYNNTTKENRRYSWELDESTRDQVPEQLELIKQPSDFPF